MKKWVRRWDSRGFAGNAISLAHAAENSFGIVLVERRLVVVCALLWEFSMLVCTRVVESVFVSVEVCL